jgi:hypothetical protein
MLSSFFKITEIYQYDGMINFLVDVWHMWDYII